MNFDLKKIIQSEQERKNKISTPPCPKCKSKKTFEDYIESGSDIDPARWVNVLAYFCESCGHIWQPEIKEEGL